MNREVFPPMRTFRSAAILICVFLILTVLEASSQQLGTGLASLPLDAQGPISAALGRDDSGYSLHRNADGFRGENSRQALVAEFTRQGAEVRSHNLRWGLQTRGYGYGDALHPLKAVAPQAKANRVEYRREGVTEWYENGPLGLEQGFTLAHPPGKANGQALAVELGLGGNLVAALEPGGKAVQLRRKDGGAALRYTGLQARDATGRELRSWLELRGERLLLRVEDGRAKYPLVVDPWIQQAELTASDGVANDDFGWSVAMDGSTAVVGAPYHSGPGAAYVFVESGGTWSQLAELTASDGVAGDRFGGSVAISGSTAVVLGAGRAYVFSGSGGTWSQQQELTPPDGVFGAVAVDGSTIVAGAPSQNGSQGAAYVFVESGGTWSQQAELTASDGVSNDQFGWSVAISGSTAVAGAVWHTVGSNPYQGAAYLFVRSGGTWSQQAELTASDGRAYDLFGTSVAVDGSTAVAGAVWHTVGSNSDQGAAYVFVPSGGTWSQQAELTASDGVARDELGYSVAVSGGTVVAGVAYHAVGSNMQRGATYVFVQNGETWSQQAELTASDGRTGVLFGNSAAVSGSSIVAGAPRGGQVLDGNPLGAAYVFGSSGPLYTLSAAPSSLSVPQGGQGTITSTITITQWNGFSGSVSFSASGLPNGVTAAFNPNPTTNTSTLTLTVTASATVTPGTTTITVVGVSGSLTQITLLTLTVTPAPVVAPMPTSVSFGSEVVNITSAPRTVTLKNTGTALLNITNIATSGSFAISSKTCGATLAVGAKCKVSVTFTPTVLGKLTGTLTFTDNAASSPQTVALSGTGVLPATLTPASTTYKKQAVGTTSPPKTFTLTNNQTVALTGIAISTTGEFAVSATTCTGSLAGKGKCTISVTFKPTATGTRTGKLSVSDSANNSPQTSSLKGTGN